MRPYICHARVINKKMTMTHRGHRRTREARRDDVGLQPRALWRYADCCKCTEIRRRERRDRRAGALTLTHLRGSTDYRSCQHLAQRSVLTQLNGSPKTSVNTAVNTVLTHAPGKTRVYLQKTRYTREIPGSASMPRAPYSQGPCANCGSHRLLKYAHRTMCARYRCQKAASRIGAAPGAAGRWRCGRCGRADILLQD